MTSSGNRYFILHKPYNMVSQFVSSHKVNLLGDLGFTFPENIHAVGRLDNRSEGLLILTNDKKITRLLFESEQPHKRVYLVQVKRIVSEETLNLLRSGVSIRIKGGGDYTTTPCGASIVEDPSYYFQAAGRVKEYQPYTWLLITLTEGKFHQVRKMVAAVNHQCKRLIRVAIEDLTLDGLQPGAIREMDGDDFFNKLKISNPLA